MALVNAFCRTVAMNYLDILSHFAYFVGHSTVNIVGFFRIFYGELSRYFVGRHT